MKATPPAKRGKPTTPDLKSPQRMHSDSRPNRIAMLEVGECEPAVVRIPLAEAVVERINAAITDLKGTMSKAAMRAAERSGNTYSTESGTALTSSNDIIVFAVVTRTA